MLTRLTERNQTFLNIKKKKKHLNYFLKNGVNFQILPKSKFSIFCIHSPILKRPFLYVGKFRRLNRRTYRLDFRYISSGYHNYPWCLNWKHPWRVYLNFIKPNQSTNFEVEQPILRYSKWIFLQLFNTV